MELDEVFRLREFMLWCFVGVEMGCIWVGVEATG